jgi:hypothetical protein
MPIQLPPDTADLKITFTIPKEISPYVTEWYQATKKPTDTPSSFLLRLIKNMAIAERINGVNSQLNQTTRNTQEANQIELSTLIEQ